ncbi:MAG: TrbI/VirB10 family protein [Acidobacteria bacterium]|nr:MAG: TrbI/VirB10 family protein [Acidobacteriota bacterium]
MNLGTRNAKAHRAFLCAALVAVALWGVGCGQQQSATAEKEKSETLTAGTEIVAALQNTIDTGENKVGDRVNLRTVEDVRINEVTVVPAGSTINGEVTHVDGAGRVAGGAELTLRFTELVTPDGKSYPISATPLRLEGKGDAKKSALQIGGGAVAGGVIGGILGGKDDIGKGAAVGAAVGTGVAVATKGKQIVLPAGQKIKVTLDGPVTIVVKSIAA